MLGIENSQAKTTSRWNFSKHSSQSVPNNLQSFAKQSSLILSATIRVNRRAGVDDTKNEFFYGFPEITLEFINGFYRFISEAFRCPSCSWILCGPPTKNIIEWIQFVLRDGIISEPPRLKREINYIHLIHAPAVPVIKRLLLIETKSSHPCGENHIIIIWSMSNEYDMVGHFVL